MKTQAMKCSHLEVIWLNHWRRKGYRIGRNQAIPCSDFFTPRRQAFLNRLMALSIILGVISLPFLWLGKAASI